MVSCGLIADVSHKQHDKITRQQYRMPHRYYNVSQIHGLLESSTVNRLPFGNPMLTRTDC